VIAAWKRPSLIAAIVVVSVGGFYLGGPGLGMALGALAAASIVWIAIRNPPRAPIWPAPLQDFRRYLLIVIDAPLEDPKATARITELARIGDRQLDEPEVRVLVLAHQRFIDRWTSDRERAHRHAGRNLVLALASLAQVGIAATAKTSEEDAVQAVEDELRVFPATDVILIESDRRGSIDEASSSELKSRLECDFWCISSCRSAPPRRRGSHRHSPARQAAGIAALMGIPPWPVGAFIASQQPLRSPGGDRDRRRRPPSS
jgi:hypothetical protein